MRLKKKLKVKLKQIINKYKGYIMKISLLKKSTFFLALIVCLMSLDVSAKSIKAGMKARLPEIIALKEKGIIGENGKGFLQYAGDVKEKESVVNAENADRENIYKAIAKKQKTTASLVGERRAKQIAAKTKAGYWLQKPDGKWYKK